MTNKLSSLKKILNNLLNKAQKLFVGELKLQNFLRDAISCQQSSSALIVKEETPIPLEDIDEASIQAKMSELEQSMHAISTKLYEAAAAEMAEEKEESDDDGVVDADFEVVDSDDEDQD